MLFNALKVAVSLLVGLLGNSGGTIPNSIDAQVFLILSNVLILEIELKALGISALHILNFFLPDI